MLENTHHPKAAFNAFGGILTFMPRKKCKAKRSTHMNLQLATVLTPTCRVIASVCYNLAKADSSIRFPSSNFMYM